MLTFSFAKPRLFIFVIVLLLASQTAAEQKKVIREFENGDVNLLIATTVAEEGLDIPACSYVIRLDMPGNEISTAQSRGRVRTEKGKYDYIASEDSGLIEKEELNMVKEILMVKAVESVQKMNCEDFLTKVCKESEILHYISLESSQKQFINSNKNT